MAAVAAFTSMPVVLVALVLAGVGWVVVLSVLNTAMMLSLPSWVRGRSLAVYSVAFMGGQGIGSAIWGLVATPLGPVLTLVVATGLMVIGQVTMPIWPLYRKTGALDRDIASMPETMPSNVIPASAGPVQIQIEYKVAADQVSRFEQAARALATSRRRTGASTWDLWQDLARPGRFIEQYTLATWGEHLAQREERVTGYDRELERAVNDLAAPNPRVRHLVRPEHMPRVDRGIAVAGVQDQAPNKGLNKGLNK
jgi:quinol monooxygenase YgiN